MRALVIGGGTMGRGIAAALAISGFEVELADADDATATVASEGAATLLDDAVGRRKLEPADAAAAAARIVPLASIADAASAPEVVIEAVPEQLELKRSVLAQAEELGPALLATNTSALSIDAVAVGLRRPQDFLGLHFFNPVPAMKLVEVVLGSATAPRTREAALRLVEELAKEAVVVRDAPGFATSRLGVGLGLEAIRMVEEGIAAPADIDRAMVLGYRHPVGPLRLGDLVGLDVRLSIAEGLAAAYGPRFEPPQLLVDMVAEGLLGQKSGKGFYDWISS